MVSLLGRGWIADLKTINTLTDNMIDLHCRRYGYHISMAAYQAGLKALTNKTADLRFVFVCTDAPHDRSVHRLEGEELKLGHRKWRELPVPKAEHSSSPR